MKEKKLNRIRERADEMKDESSETEEWIEFREQFGLERGDHELRAMLEEPELRQAYREIYKREKELEEEEERYYEEGFRRLEAMDEESRLLGEQDYVEHPLDQKLFDEWEESLSVKQVNMLGIPRDEHSDISDEEFREVWNEWKLLNRMGQFEHKDERSDDEDSLVIQEFADDDLDVDLEGKKKKEDMRYFEKKELEAQVRRKKHYALEEISYEFRKDMMNLRRLYHKAKLKKEQVMENDPFFPQEEGIEDKEREMIDGRRKESKMERFKKELEKKYFDAKFRYYCGKILRRYDKMQSKEEEIEAYWREHHPDKEYKQKTADFMFQDIDWNSDRSYVRNAILRDRAKRVTLKEIGRTLDKFILADKAKHKVNILKNEEQGQPEAVTTNQQGRDFYWTEALMSSFKAKRPLFMEKEMEAELKKKSPQVRAIYEDAKKIAEKEDGQRRYDVTTLTEDEKYEIELFHAFKKDPYFQHYVKYDLLKAEESTRETMITLPLYMRAIRMDDFVKFHDYSKIDFARKIVKDTSKRVVIDGKAWGSGKRKSCKAFAYVQDGNGLMTINGKSYIRHFPSGINFRNKIIHAIMITGLQARIDVHMRVYGGGTTGQQDALSVAVGRALANYFPPARDILNKAGYMRNDPRKVERKKPGRYKARKSYVYQRR